MPEALSPDFVQQMLRADPSWKDIAMRHVFSDLSVIGGEEELDHAALFDELMQLDDAGIKDKFGRDDWSWYLQERYDDLNPQKAFEVVVNMVYMLDANARRLLEKQAAELTTPQQDPAEVDSTPESFTVWCRQADGRGTTWLSAVQATSVDEAVEKGRSAAASDWGYEGREDEILVVGCQCKIPNSNLIWDDDGLGADASSDADVAQVGSAP
ncbi:MAG: hypothetical protein K2W33_10640 [Burkholderiales bacterium]|nr:hypothetical protein [Burkholderiales bacterium]